MNKVFKNSWALFMGMGAIMLAYGYQNALLGVRAVIEDFSLASTGFMMSGYFVGYFIGARTIPSVISGVGHIRVFAAFASVASLAILVHSIFITFFAALYIFYDSIKLGNFFGDILGFVAAMGLAVGAVIIRSAKKLNLVPSAVVGKLIIALFAMLFVKDYSLNNNDIYIVPLMCVMCVAIPFVLVTIAPRFITAAEVNLFFLLETIIGPIWVWLIIKEQPTPETIVGGAIIVLTIATHSFLKLKKS